jgi:hypothetical protein
LPESLARDSKRRSTSRLSPETADSWSRPNATRSSSTMATLALFFSKSTITQAIASSP